MKITDSEKFDSVVYREISQYNPIRWQLLYREGEEEFRAQAKEMKCKDFFNDVVAFFQGGEKFKFGIYGFDNAIKKNDEGIYMLVSSIRDKESFFLNLSTLNTQLQKDLGCVLSWLDAGKERVIILIPNDVWATTYRISMVTMCVRLCNYGNVYREWKDFWHTDAPSWKFENAFTPQARHMALKNGFKVPSGYEQYWWYAGMLYNSEKVSSLGVGTSTLIHNNGVSSWTNAFDTEKEHEEA